jgi:hypothetical protein
MGGADAQNGNAVRNHYGSTFLDHPCLVSSFSQHSWNSLQPQLVDRTLKGDRLTNVPAAGKIGSKAQPSFVKALKVPIGCDRVFSSMSSPQSSTIFGRCLV